MEISPMSFERRLQPTGRYRVGMSVATDELFSIARELIRGGYRVGLIGGHDDGDQLRVVYLFMSGPPDRRIELSVKVPKDNPRIPSLAALSFPASRFEREVHDMFGIEPVGHPRPSRLVLHPIWPDNFYPMRHDNAEMPDFKHVSEQFQLMEVEGRGVYEIPVGPIHAGLIEPGHFRFSVVGETIINMRARLWYMHRGVEKMFEGIAVNDGVGIAEKISGDTSVGHSIAYCKAIEDALMIPVTGECLVLRAILLEMERLYNHVADLGMLCNDVAYGVLQAHFYRVRERLLRLNKTITGSRLLRGAITVGRAELRQLPNVAELDEIADDVAELVEIALDNAMVTERFRTTSVLREDAAKNLGVVGYVARASGLVSDARIAHGNSGLYSELDVAASSSGDVYARFMVRVDELVASVKLLKSWCVDVQCYAKSLQNCEACNPRPVPAGANGTRSGIGIVEAWRGTLVHRVEIDGAGKVSRLRAVDPSFFNWPAISVALNNTIVPDFPLTNKSFNLSYAGNDL